MKKALHDGHVEPAIEFTTHLGLNPNEAEPTFLVKRPRSCPGSLNSGKNGMQTRIFSDGQRMGEK